MLTKKEAAKVRIEIIDLTEDYCKKCKFSSRQTTIPKECYECDVYKRIRELGDMLAPKVKNGRPNSKVNKRHISDVLTPKEYARLKIVEKTIDKMIVKKIGFGSGTLSRWKKANKEEIERYKNEWKECQSRNTTD